MATNEDKDKTAPGRQPRADQQRQTSAATSSGPGGGVAQELRDSHERRTTVPGADNVDARLDNRTGADRPPLETFPAKPQQIDGPDVMHQVEHTRRVLAEREDVTGERKGMFSPGPHGLSDESLRDGPTSFGTEGLSVDEAGKGAPKANG